MLIKEQEVVVIMASYREKWFKANPGKKRLGHRGLWWKCVNCHEWFHKEDIDVDHRLPKRDGGTDDLWNLQPMCKHCNRSKRDRQTTGETLSTMARAAVHGELGKAIGGVAKQKLKDAVGIKYKR